MAGLPPIGVGPRTERDRERERERERERAILFSSQAKYLQILIEKNDKNVHINL